MKRFKRFFDRATPTLLVLWLGSILVGLFGLVFQYAFLVSLGLHILLSLWTAKIERRRPN